MMGYKNVEVTATSLKQLVDWNPKMKKPVKRANSAYRASCGPSCRSSCAPGCGTSDRVPRRFKTVRKGAAK